MSYPSVEIGEARMALVNGENHSPRMENISQLAFAYVQQLMERELQHLGAEVTIAHLEIPPIQVAFDTMDDEAIARASAEGIYRALLQAL
jgi:hypothetical protein